MNNFEVKENTQQDIKDVKPNPKEVEVSFNEKNIDGKPNPKEVDPKIKESASYLMKEQDFADYRAENANGEYTLKTDGHFTKESDGVHSQVPLDKEGKPDGKYVTSFEAMDKMLDRAYNDTESYTTEINKRRESEGKDPIEAKPLRIAEDQLGLKEGQLGERAIRVDVPDADRYDLQAPNGKESTANENYKEGGKTSGGMPEAKMMEDAPVNTEKISIYKNQ